jgi:lipopolysaccharide transport system ATP-binding protein
MKDRVSNTKICIIVRHQEEIIRDICTRCVLLEHGSIIADGATNEILDFYHKRYS